MVSLRIFLTSRKYFATAFLYACFSLIFSTWVTYIPHISSKLNITEGKIGQAIFFSGLGAFFMIRISRHIAEKVGVGRYTYISLVAYCISFFGMFMAWDYTTLCISLFVFGMAGSNYAISLNSLLATIEKQDGVYIMTGSHGFWSIGGMIGSATGGFMAALLDHPLLHVGLVVFIILAVQTALRSQYVHRVADRPAREEKSTGSKAPLLLIAVIGLVVMVSEGAIADWSALYLKKIIHLNIGYIGFGYSLFSLAMMIGRFTGDTLSQRLGSWRLISLASLLALVGFGLVLVLHPAFSLIGFFVIGLGFSVIVPEVYRLASRLEGIHTAYGVSFIAATTNIGFLVGPVLLGFIAEMDSLHLSFMVLTGWVSLAFIISSLKNGKNKREQAVVKA
ncbi:MAG: MFS transporter [Bacteroidales bacterium]